MYNFKQAAINEVTLSALMNGRSILTTEDAIKTFPNGFTINDFDFVFLKDKDPYVIVTIKENDDVFLAGGMVLTKIFNTFVEDLGSVEKAQEEYAKTDKLKVILSETKTKDGKNLTRVEII